MRAGLTQQQVADAAGVTRSTVSRVEAHTMQPTYVMLQRLIIATGLEIRPLLEAHDDHDDVLDRLDALDPVRAERDGRAAERLDRALTAATVSSGQARLLHRPDIMAAIDDVATNPDAGVRRGRPRRRRHT